MEICLIDAEGLDEEIRCEMCRNPMRSDTGCDGGCTYDEKLYEKIVHLLNERIKPLPNIKPEPRWIPCAERMPKSGEPVLITYRTWRSYLRKYVYFVTIGWHANRYSVREDSFSEWEDDCDYDEDGDVFYIREGWYEFTTQGNCDHASWGICDAEVTAWMPLPAPYEEDTND